MFRKIVSNLSFSPALVGQLAFYAKRLRKEEATRRIGLVFVALALVVQVLAVFDPPQSANAIDAADLVPGGLGVGSTRSLNKFLAPYDANTGHLQDIMNFAGITRAEIASAQYSSFLTSSNTLDWGRVPYAGTQAVTVTNTTGTANILTVYVGSLTTLNGKNTRIYGWIGHSAKIGWFAIMQACGNLVTNSIPAAPTPPPAPAATPTVPAPAPPAPLVIPAPAAVTESKAAVNLTQGNVDATTVTAQADDQIQYTITAQNNGGTATYVTFQDNLADALDYSTLVDPGGGSFDAPSKNLSWPSVSIGPGQTQSRQFLMKMLDTIPSMAQGQSWGPSYDCKIINTFGNTITINVACPAAKVVEQTVTALPHTGPTENMLFAGIVLAVVAYFYARARQVGKEVRLIRRDLNVGTI